MLDIMKGPQKSFVATGILRVLLFCGCTLLIVVPIPAGLLAVYLARSDYHLNWSLAVLAGFLMVAAVALVGFILTRLGAIIVERRIKSLGYHDIENAA
jgi:hypothetical protein